MGAPRKYALGLDSSAPEYRIWSGMKQRCCNPNLKSWLHYGGRGITVCERWQESFEAFMTDVGRRPTPQHSLDRINNDGNYEPGNCRWATSGQQGSNRKRRAVVTSGAIEASRVVREYIASKNMSPHGLAMLARVSYSVIYAHVTAGRKLSVDVAKRIDAATDGELSAAAILGLKLPNHAEAI